MREKVSNIVILVRLMLFAYIKVKMVCIIIVIQLAVGRVMDPVAHAMFFGMDRYGSQLIAIIMDSGIVST